MRDATIIGAGPAGSAMAILLARRGWSVTLIEQHRFPRDKVCGECLSAIGVETIVRLGLLQASLSKGAVWLHHASIHATDGRSAAIPLPRPMLGISRHALDLLLLDCAIEAGAIVGQPARCESLESREDSVIIHVRDLIENRVETLTPSFVILADGKSALPGPTPAGTDDIGIKAHWENIAGARDMIELFGFPGCYGGLAPIENDRWNTAFSIPAERLRRHRGKIDAVFTELLAENTSFQARLAGARRVGPWLAAPLPRFAVRRDYPGRVIRVGNAAAALEPIGGEGMGLALRSAEIAAEMLDASFPHWGPDQHRKLRGRYNRLWRTRRIACRAAAMVVSSTKRMGIAIECIRANERLTRGVMGLLGKRSDPAMVIPGGKSRELKWREYVLLRLLPGVFFWIAFMLAMRPEDWAGSMLAVAFIGTPLLVIFMSAMIGPRSEARRRFQRRMAGECVLCGYSMRGNISGRCPECGQAADQSKA